MLKAVDEPESFRARHGSAESLGQAETRYWLTQLVNQELRR